MINCCRVKVVGAAGHLKSHVVLVSGSGSGSGRKVRDKPARTREWGARSKESGMTPSHLLIHWVPAADSNHNAVISSHYYRRLTYDIWEMGDGGGWGPRKRNVGLLICECVWKFTRGEKIWHRWNSLTNLELYYTNFHPNCQFFRGNPVVAAYSTIWCFPAIIDN